MHERLSVHAVTFQGAPLAELETQWRLLGLQRLSLIDSLLPEPELQQLVDRADPADVRAERDGLSRAAEQAGVTLAIENVASLYADIHLAHTLRDTMELTGPRIEQEGRFDAARRACTRVTAMLHRIGA